MKKFIGILIIIFFLLIGAGVFTAIVMAGIGIIYVALRFHEVIMMLSYGKGAEIAEKLTGEKYTR